MLCREKYQDKSTIFPLVELFAVRFNILSGA